MSSALWLAHVKAKHSLHLWLVRCFPFQFELQVLFKHKPYCKIHSTKVKASPLITMCSLHLYFIQQQLSVGTNTAEPSTALT